MFGPYANYQYMKALERNNNNNNNEFNLRPLDLELFGDIVQVVSNNMLITPILLLPLLSSICVLLYFLIVGVVYMVVNCALLLDNDYFLYTSCFILLLLICVLIIDLNKKMNKFISIIKSNIIKNDHKFKKINIELDTLNITITKIENKCEILCDENLEIK
jgi:hypothetical protein